MPKARYAIVLWLAAMALPWAAACGSLFKVVHWPSVELMSLVAGAIQLMAVAMLAGKIMAYPRLKDFLER